MNPETSPNPGGKLIRLLRPSLVVLCGPSACGKSTFAKRHFRPTQIISSDWARALVCDDERDQRFNSQAFELVHFLVKQRLGLNRLCVVDSTALTAHARRDLLFLARNNQVPTTLMIFRVPLETCVARDEKRERSVGRSVVERQYQNFELSLDAMRQEGFDQVVELQNGDLDQIRFEILFRPIQRPQPTDARPSARPNRSGDPVNRGQGGNGAGNSSAARPAAPPLVQPTASDHSRPTPSVAPPQSLALNQRAELHSPLPATIAHPATPIASPVGKKELA